MKTSISSDSDHVDAVEAHSQHEEPDGTVDGNGLNTEELESSDSGVAGSAFADEPEEKRELPDEEIEVVAEEKEVVAEEEVQEDTITSQPGRINDLINFIIYIPPVKPIGQAQRYILWRSMVFIHLGIDCLVRMRAIIPLLE